MTHENTMHIHVKVDANGSISTYKHIGVILDHHLNFKDMIDHTCNSVNRKLYIPRKVGL